jgi:hypothetical protein
MKVEVHESYLGEFDLGPREIEAKLSRALAATLTELTKADTYQSHTFEPKVGDSIKNVNPKCKHFKSEGVVTAVKSLSGGKGTTVAYRTTNDGPTWKSGDILEKTLDQLAPRADKLRKAHGGGEVDVLEDLTQHVAELYRQRVTQLQQAITEVIRES